MEESGRGYDRLALGVNKKEPKQILKFKILVAVRVQDTERSHCLSVGHWRGLRAEDPESMEVIWSRGFWEIDTGMWRQLWRQSSELMSLSLLCGPGPKRREISEMSSGKA